MTTVSLEDVLNQFQVTPNKLLDIMQLDPRDVVYVSGSMVEGFGNPYSDLDLFVIKKKIDSVEAQFQYEDFRIQIVTLGNNRFDVEYHPYHKVEEKIRMAKTFDPADLNSLERLTVKRIDFLHRLRVSHPLYNETNWAGLVSQIPKEQVCAALKTWRLRSFNAHVMDCTGMLKVGRPHRGIHRGVRTGRSVETGPCLREGRSGRCAGAFQTENLRPVEGVYPPLGYGGSIGGRADDFPADFYGGNV